MHVIFYSTLVVKLESYYCSFSICHCFLFENLPKLLTRGLGQASHSKAFHVHSILFAIVLLVLLIMFFSTFR